MEGHHKNATKQQNKFQKLRETDHLHGHPCVGTRPVLSAINQGNGCVQEEENRSFTRAPVCQNTARVVGPEPNKEKNKNRAFTRAPECRNTARVILYGLDFEFF